MEREIRTSMKAERLTSIPLYPELRQCSSPSAPRILETIADAQRHHLVIEGKIQKVFDPELTPLHQQVLDLLHLPVSVYASAKVNSGGGHIGHQKCGTSVGTMPTPTGPGPPKIVSSSGHCGQPRRRPLCRFIL